MITEDEIIRLRQCEKQSIIRGNELIDLGRQVVKLRSVVEKLREALACSVLENSLYEREIAAAKKKTDG